MWRLQVFHKSICDKDGDVRYKNQQSCYQFKLMEIEK